MLFLKVKGMCEEVYKHLPSLKKISEHFEELDNQDTDRKHIKRYNMVQAAAKRKHEPES